ncbi:MAG TPA: hypothetical protein VFP40_09305, partial [Terriglobales bacterium]|nr:hypothetical protein [Terriglobales bacterium]
LRFEFFNIFNRTNFRNMVSDYSLQTVMYDNNSGNLVNGTQKATKITEAPVAKSFGMATSDVGPREIQYSIKFTF